MSKNILDGLNPASSCLSRSPVHACAVRSANSTCKIHLLFLSPVHTAQHSHGMKKRMTLAGTITGGNAQFVDHKLGYKINFSPLVLSISLIHRNILR